MPRVLATLALVAALLAPVASRADEASAAINAFTAEQLLDCVTTMAVLRSGGRERDPIAVPFTHSALTEFGAAAVLNIVMRRMPIHILKTVVNVYPVILIGNVRALGGSTVPQWAPIGASPGTPLRLHPHPHR